MYRKRPPRTRWSVVSGIRNVFAGVVAGVVLELTFGGSGTFHGVSGSGDVMQHRVLRGLQSRILPYVTAVQHANDE